MLSFIWSFLKTAFSAFMLLLAHFMLLATFANSEWEGRLMAGIPALVFLGLAIAPWLFSRREKADY